VKKFYILLLLGYVFSNIQTNLFAQSVLNPTDAIVEYNPDSLPTEPPYGEIGKWVRTKSLSWNSDSYKCYIYEGSCFRLKFPKTYKQDFTDNKKYPLAIVFHGAGEAGIITDNESDLYHGGLEYMNAVDSGIFDGYVMFMQSQGTWGVSSYQKIIDIINYMITNNKLDPFRISVNGLSAGGQAAWDMIINYPSYIAASLPMSNVSIGYKDSSVVNTVKFTPMWNFQGGLDGSPSSSTAQQVRDAMLSAGGNYHYSEYADIGHNTWDNAFAEPGFFPFIDSAYSSNPWALFGRTGFCNGDTINLTLGVAPGFDGYQWRKDNIIIKGAISNAINVTSLGTYEARVLKGTLWSDWSHLPVKVQITPPTVTPPITPYDNMSNVIAADGKNYVNLEVPGNQFISYQWKRVGSDSVISNQKIYTATQPGQYIAAAIQQYGCSSIFSPSFPVINANGQNPPDQATNLTATAISSTVVLLNWENNPHPVHNETFFEIYRSTSQDGVYNLAGKASTDVLKYQDSNLSPGLNYFYKVRAINDSGAAPFSNIAQTITLADKTPPTPPGNLQIIYATNSSIKIQWDTSTDNVGVENYQVYVNGIKTYSTLLNNFTVNALQQGKIYSFYVKAIDSSGNESVQSNIANSPAVLKGLLYKYYEGYYTSMPDFTALSPLTTGVSSNADISISNRQIQYAFLWQGFINVPADGSYKFTLNADDGSSLWLNAYDPSIKPLASYDTAQVGATYNSGFISLKKGLYPVSIGYYQNKGAKRIKIYWANSGLFGDTLNHAIEDKYFISDYNAPDTAPAAPDGVSVNTTGSDKIKISWNDKSNNETAYQIYRSLKPNISYQIVFTTTANAIQYVDSGLDANTKYYYKINAVNNYSTSAFTNYVSSTTLKMPAPPKAPTNLKAKALSASSIQLTWVDADSDEINYQVLRSLVDSLNLKQVTLLPANSISFTDTGLYGNTNYFYKVNAISAVSYSINKPAVNIKTKNNAPVINNKFTQKNIPYGTQTILNITASDADADLLSFSATSLPVFARLTDNGNGTASLIFNPLASQQKTYQKIKVIVKDTFGGSDTDVFKLTVNSNYNPVIDSIIDYSISEDDTLSIPLSASDNNPGDILTWSVIGMPKNYSLSSVSNGKINLILKPAYTSAGFYSIQVTVKDGKGGSATTTFNVTVNDKDPNLSVYLRFNAQDTVGSPWNNITGVNSSNFKDVLNRNTTIGLQMQTDWWSTWNEGAQTGNNSGIFPDAVMKDYYYFGVFGGPETVTSNITGLDTSKLYSISFYGNSNWSQATDNGSTIYTIGSQSVSVSVQNNTATTADFNNIKPASDGTITFTMSKAANATAGYLNAIIINSLYTDSLKPATPTFLTANNIAGKGVQLLWNDVAYNETNYKVFRSLKAGGPFTLIKSNLVFNSTTFLDTTTAGRTQYFYMVKASNNNGVSNASNTVSVITSDRIPKINAVPDVFVKNNQQLTIAVTVVDDATDHIVLKANNLPSFVTFTDNGNGTGSVNINPSTGITGTFNNITITATDNSDSSSLASFNINILDANTNSVYVNFSGGSIAPAPWNNFTVWPSANTTLSNLYDDSNSPTTISLKLINGFQGVAAAGMQAGDNKNIYPETVVRTALYEGTPNTDTILVSGLSTNKKYNFIFFNSHDDGLNGNTVFTINDETVTLNAMHNTNKTVEINGINADANGQIIIKVSKDAGADFAYLSSLVIQSYNADLPLLSPADLRVTETGKNAIQLQWADRSADETAFELWRATDSTGNYSLLNTLQSNSTTYFDSNLIAGATYYYIIRAIKNNVQSAFTNPVAATTYSQAIYVNFTFNNNANTPWNNTQQLPQAGYLWNNLLDDSGIPSSVGINELTNFAGLYDAGMNTSNNTGIFSDKVIADSYGLFTGETAQLKITGLNLNKKYDFTFFASSQAYGDVNTAYMINGKKSILNASLNVDGTVTIYNVLPDKNGEVIISIAPNSISSQYGLIGALIIKEYCITTNKIPPAPQSFGNNLQSSNNSIKKTSSIQANKNSIPGKMLAYPNPFNSSFTISFSLENKDDVEVELYDVTGKIVYRKNFGNLEKGLQNLKIIPNVNIPAGVYFIKMSYVKTSVSNYIKILKQ
jgi:fibronectin type 3 domain-containing protein/predicted esterase